MTKTAKIAIDVVSDTICPWCFVGKRRMEAALSEFPDVEFEVRWFPYQIAPQAPAEGVNKLQAVTGVYGPRVPQMITHMTKVYKELGLDYSMGGLTGNTLDSHRLIHWAGQVGGAAKQNDLVEELFKNYFTQEKYIGDHEVLVAAAQKVGLPGAQAREYLADPNNGRAEVFQQIQQAARSKSISGVPNFSIGGRVVIPGAADPEVFRQAITEVLQRS